MSNAHGGRVCDSIVKNLRCVVRIEKLTLKNFRLFEQREFSFHPQFNLIIGENGSGKSSLLNGIAISLNYFITRLIGKQSRLLLTDDDCYTKINIDSMARELSIEPMLPIALLLDGETSFTKTNYEADDAEEDINLEEAFRAIDTPFLSVESYVGTYDNLGMPSVEDSFGGEEIHLNWPMNESFYAPLFAFYGCSRLWLPKPNKKLYENAMKAQYSRRDGYKNWAIAQADSAQLGEWLLKQEIIAFQEKKKPIAYQILNIALKKCFEDFGYLSFIAKEGDLVVHFEDGRCQLFKHMSDGQRCMIGLIGDMVRRAVLLNPQLGDKILEETSGVVLIDELDLHLHPKWQRRIIDDLKTTFPKVQFICTTHSPQLIGQAKPEEIIILDQETTHHPAQSYGMDSNWILRHVMGGQDRDPVIAAKLDEVFEDIENANFEMAQSKIAELRKEISGEHPELVEAEGLVDRYTRFSLDDIED